MADNPSPECSGSEELHQSNSQDEPGTHRRPKIAIREWIDLNDFSNPEDVDGVIQLYDKKQKLNEVLINSYVGLEKAEEINGWSSRKKRKIIEWKNLIEYQFTVNWFFVYELKKKEGWWSWLIIVISTITSTLSLIRTDNPYASIGVSVALSGFSVITTLIAAWIKKQNYVDRIKNLDRYIQKLGKLNVEIEYTLTKAPWDRQNYDKFMELYEPQIIQLLSSSPPMSPEEFKTAVWQLTRYYPELVKDTYPWYDKNERGNYVMTEWGRDILNTYEAVYYSSFSRRIFGCYYCLCKCINCKKSDNYIVELYNNGSDCDQIPIDIWSPPPPSSIPKDPIIKVDQSFQLRKSIRLPKTTSKKMVDGAKMIELAGIKSTNLAIVAAKDKANGPETPSNQISGKKTEEL